MKCGQLKEVFTIQTLSGTASALFEPGLSPGLVLKTTL